MQNTKLSPQSSKPQFNEVNPKPKPSCDGSNQVFPNDIPKEEHAERKVNEACKACDRFIGGTCIGKLAL